MFTKIGEERAFDAILGQIIENIQSGELKAGDALPAERMIAESMGVSRPAVREVLRALELLGKEKLGTLTGLLFEFDAALCTALEEKGE